MTTDTGGAERITDRPGSTVGEGVQRLELDYPDELSYDENPLMGASVAMENPILAMENPLMAMERFEYEGFED